MRLWTLKARASLYRMRRLLAVLALWLAAAALAFRFFGRLSWHDALLSALYLKVQPDAFSQGYSFWGQSFVFGVVIALILRETMENYAERCRLMAGLLRDHTIIIGYTHLGKRLVGHCINNKIPYCLIEKNRALVDDLLRKGEPVVVDDACTPDALPSANIKHARQVILASNNIETAIIVTKNARDANPEVHIAARCAMDNLVGVLEKLGADYVYSASLAAYNEITKILKV
ncbi:MAG: NAD-binding protein [Elusimicrobia bacterium]|nr:NAD-binding protein [Elusimicrobiota bacterium]